MNGHLASELYGMVKTLWLWSRVVNICQGHYAHGANSSRDSSGELGKHVGLRVLLAGVSAKFLLSWKTLLLC